MRAAVIRCKMGARVMPNLADPDAVLAAARLWVGTPYVLGAALRGAGCDCVGLIRGVLADVAGGPVPDVPGWRVDWAQVAGRPLFEAAALHLAAALPEPRHGDVIAFRIAGREAHVGILAPRGRVIHAVERIGVVEVPLGAYADRIAFRVAFPAAR